jgi:hypothetical protein
VTPPVLSLGFSKISQNVGGDLVSSCLLVLVLSAVPKSSRDNSVGIATGLRAGRPGFDFRHGMKSYLYTTAFRPALGSIPGFFPRGWSSRGIKLTTILHLVLRLKIRGAMTPLPPISSWRGA